MIEIREVKTNKELKEFVKFPYQIYKDNPNWVPPLIFDEMNTLRKDKNPAFEYCEAKYWMAYKDGKAAGRVAGIINNSYLKKWDKKRIRFGWFDFIDDFEVCKALIDTVEKWGKEKGMEEIHGPLGFCDLDREGLLIDGYDRLGTFVTVYNHPYYKDYLEKYGFEKDVDWIEYEIKAPEKEIEVISKIAERTMKYHDYKVLDIKKPKDILPYANGIFELLNEAYKDLYSVVTLTDKQIDSYIKQYFSYVNPEYIKVILDNNDNVIAFGICMPSLSKAMQKCNGRIFPFGFIHILKALKKCERIDLYLVAVKPELKNKGVTAVLLDEITRAALKNGVKSGETTPMLEQNTRVTLLWKYYNPTLYKRTRCFVKKLQD